MFVKSPAASSDFLFCENYPRPSTTLLFANRTFTTQLNTAALIKNLTGVIDFMTFCRKSIIEATEQKRSPSKSRIAGRVISYEVLNNAANHHRSDLFPDPLYFTSDYVLERYFMKASRLETVAILRIETFNSESIEEFHSNLTEFLHACVMNGKQHLILDIQINGGGNIGLGYDVFQQLFPDAEPFTAGNLCSHEQLNVMGEFITRFAHEVLEDSGSI